MITTADAWICYNFHATFNGGPLVIWYVGVCRASQYANLYDLNRNSEFIEKGEYLKDHAFSINCCTLGEASALAMQALLIKPSMHLNTGHPVEPVKVTRRGSPKRVRSLTDGSEWESGTEFARDFGLSNAAVSQHLKRGTGKIAGHELVRIDE